MSADPLNVLPAAVNLLDFDRPAMETYFAERGEKRFRAQQLLKWIHQEGVSDFAAMTNLSKSLRARLELEATLTRPEVVADRLSRDGTRKWALKLADGNVVETVFIPEEGRGTLCVSSQAGCPLDCAFCHTARQGFNRNLKTSEIIAQLLIAREALGEQMDSSVTNVVMMGMGEPLLNFDAVVRATNLMMDDFAFGLSKRRVTLSTAGVVPALYRLAEVSDVSLAVSLHAANDELRDRLVPINRKYPLQELLAACRNYIDRDGRRRITWEYVMLDGINDSVQQARDLVRLLQGIPSKLNLIPFNPFPDAGFRTTTPEALERFREVVINAGITTITRRTRGEDIEAACGQLTGAVLNRRGGREQDGRGL